MIKFTKAQLQFLKSKFEFDEVAFVEAAADFEPKKKVMKEVPDAERCTAIKKDGERCTKRRGKECEDKCNIHHGKPETLSIKEPSLIERVKCTAITKKGEPCKKNAIDGNMCSIHAKVPAVAAAPSVVEVGA